MRKDKFYKGPTEVEQLRIKIYEELVGLKLSKLPADQIVILSDKTEIPIDKLNAIIKAKLFSEKTTASIEFFYGLFRSGHKSDLSSLALQSDNVISNTIKRAVKKNQIPESEANDETIAININKIRKQAKKIIKANFKP